MLGKLTHTVKTLMCGVRGRRGESLVEVMTAIVIGGLAILMMQMAIAASTNVAKESRDYMSAYYTAQSDAVLTSTPADTGTVTLTEDASGMSLISSGTTESLGVTYYEAALGSSSIILYEAG